MPNSIELEALFCEIDDFCKTFLPAWHRQQLTHGERKRQRATRLAVSEIMTILIHFHQSQYRTFKAYYLLYICHHEQNAFPQRVSYQRFVALMSSVLIPLCVYRQPRRGTSRGIAFLDSTPIVVCHNRRIHSHKVFQKVAKRGKTSVGWFYGFKLHLVVNDGGELLAFHITPGNVDDRQPVPKLTQGLTGKLFGDKGYLSKALFEVLLADGLHLITRLRKGMTNHLMPLLDKLLLRKRALIETIFDQLKNIYQIEHSRHRSVTNFLVNLIGALIAYTYRPCKPSLDLTSEHVNQLSLLEKWV